MQFMLAFDFTVNNFVKSAELVQNWFWASLCVVFAEIRINLVTTIC